MVRSNTMEMRASFQITGRRHNKETCMPSRKLPIAYNLNRTHKWILGYLVQHTSTSRRGGIVSEWFIVDDKLEGTSLLILGEPVYGTE